MTFRNFTKRAAILFMALILVLSMQGSVMTYADEEDDLRNDLENIENEKNSVSSQMEETQNEIYSLEESIQRLNAEIVVKRKEIEETEGKIELKEVEMNERQTALNSRLRNMYKKGTVGFADVLLGSTSLSDFVSNVELIQSIYENDAEIMIELEKQHDELDQIKRQLDMQEKELDGKATEVVYKQKSMQAKMLELEAREKELEDEADRVTQEILRVIDEKSKYIGGEFVWPAPSSRYITSLYGYRVHPISGYDSFHNGVDIGVGAGEHIVAAAAGKVIFAGGNSNYGYGYYVILDHGGGVTTLYAHNSSLLVQEGDVVNAGDVVSLAGSTGYSTGPHLHFEVRNGAQSVDPMAYFNG